MFARCTFVVAFALIPARAQDLDHYKAFLSQVADVELRVLDKPPDPNTFVQQEMGVAAGTAAALRMFAADYRAQAAKVDAAVKQLVFERRLAAFAGETPASPTEAELVAQAGRVTDKLVQDGLQSIRAGIGEPEFARVQDFVESRKSTLEYFPRKKGIIVAR